MGLINLVTNLPDFYYYNSKGQPGGLGNFSAKKNKYGHDRKGGGSSNQPYIQTPIPEGEALNSPDFLLRNGYLNPVDSVKDVSRLLKFFSPLGSGASINGVLFTAKQELLERQNVDVDDGINRIYNPLGTLFQAGVNSIGYHINKQGFNFLRKGYLTGGKEGYYPYTNAQKIPALVNEHFLNRLAASYLIKKTNDKGIPNFFNISTLDDQVLLSYPGGPNSILGIGKTKIRIWNPTNEVVVPSSRSNPNYEPTLSGVKNLVSLGPKINWNYNPLVNENNKNFNTTSIFQQGIGVGRVYQAISPKFVPDSTVFGEAENASDVLNRDVLKSNTFTNNAKGYNDKTLDYSQIQDAHNVTVNHKGTILDFRESIQDIPSTDYTEFNRENDQFGYGYSTSKTYFAGNSRFGTQKILNPNLSISPDQVEAGVRGEDIIDFNFTLVNNEGGGSRNTLIDFRAYIEDFNDSFNGEWDAYKYMGRAENFYKYKGFTREFSLTFVVPNLSRADMMASFQKLNALSWATMPDYSQAGLMRGNLCYFTLGDYLRRSLVVIKSLSYTPIMEMGFDIDRDLDGRKFINGQDNLYVGQLPKGIRVQCGLIPLTNEIVPQSLTFYTPQRGEAFIGNRKHAIVDRDNIAAQYPNGRTADSFRTNEAGQGTNSYKADNPSLSPMMEYQKNDTTTGTNIQETSAAPLPFPPSTPPTLNTSGLRSEATGFAAGETEGDSGPQLPIDAIPTGIEGNFLQNPNANVGPRV
jgi:hypothetical protein